MNNRALKNYLLLPVLTAGIFFAVLFSAPQTARAVSLTSVFKIEITGPINITGTTEDVWISIDGYSAGNPGPLVGSDTAILRAHIKMTGPNGSPGKDNNPPDGIIDDYKANTGKLTDDDHEDILVGWVALYDENIVDDSGQGVRLKIQKKSGGDVITKDLAPRLKLAEDNTTNYSQTNKQVLVLPKTENGISFNLQVDGLDPDTEYKAWIHLEEDGMPNSVDGPEFNFKTKSLVDGQAVEPTVTSDTFSAGTSGGILIGTADSFDCSIKEFSLKNCIASFVYNSFLLPVHLLVKPAAYFLDFMVGYAIDDGAYRHPFVERGWGIVRDIANLGFIFALVYIAFRTILGLGGGQTKKMIVTLIIAALLINFSLFFTRVIIDVGNSLGHIFYNNVEVKNPNTGEDAPLLVPERKNVALALVSKVSIGNILSAGGLSPDANFGWFLLAIVLVTTLEVIMIYVFFSVGLLFVGRVIGLWLSMIFAPVAFVSYAIPGEIPYFGHKDWWTDLLKQTFMAPLFIFFLYLIVMYLESPLAPGGSSAPGSAGAAVATAAGAAGGQDFTQIFMGVIIPFAMMVVLIFAAKKIAVEFSGRIATIINKTIGGMAKTAGGVALGVATGGAALALRGTVGKFAAGRITPDLKDRALKGDKGAQRKLDFYSSLSKSSFDARSTMLGKGIQEKTGMKFGGGIVDLVGMGEKSTKGGYRGGQERKIEKADKEFKEKYALSNAEAEKQDEKANEWEGGYQREAEKFKENAKKGGAEFDEKEFRKQYESGKTSVVRDSKGRIMANNYSGTEKVKTAEETNAHRRKEYSEMKYGPHKEEEKGAYKNEVRGWMGRIGMETAGGAAKGLGFLGVGAVPGATIGFGAGVLNELKNVIVGGFKEAARPDTKVGKSFVGQGVRATRDFFRDDKGREEIKAGIRRGKSKEKKLADALNEYGVGNESNQKGSSSKTPPAKPTTPSSSPTPENK